MYRTWNSGRTRGERSSVFGIEGVGDILSELEKIILVF